MHEFFENETNRSRLRVISFELQVNEERRDRRDNILEQNQRDINNDRNRRVFNDPVIDLTHQTQQQRRDGQPSLIDSSTTTTHIVEIFSKTPIIPKSHYKMKEYFKNKTATGGGNYTSVYIHSSNRLMAFHYSDCQSKKDVLDKYVSFLAVLLLFFFCCVFYLLLKKNKKLLSATSSMMKWLRASILICPS